MSISPPTRPSSPVWLIILVLAVVSLIWTDYVRIQRADYVSKLDRENVSIDPRSPTGYAEGRRWLIVPEQNLHSYQWISQTQQMLAEGTIRVHRVTQENAPLGRQVYAPSPYRWWLGALAKVDHLLSRQPIGISVERAALVADLWLHLLLLVGSTVFVARHFGSRAAVLIALAWVALFPLSTAFIPGAPDDTSLALLCAVGSLLPLLAAWGRVGRDASADTSTPPKHDRGFLLAGVFGGLGLWISPVHQIPFLLGIAGGAVAALWLGRAKGAQGARTVSAPSALLGRPSPACWRRWAVGGAAVSLLAYLAENAPDHLGGLRLQVNHPFYALAWLGLGEVLSRIQAWSDTGKFGRSWRDGLAWGLGFLALGLVPAAMVFGKNPGFLVADPLASRLTFLTNGVEAKNFAAWLGRDGLTLVLAATVLPLLWLAWAVAQLFSRTTTQTTRLTIALALGPVVACTLLAFPQLQWWRMTDVALLGVIVAVSGGLSLPGSSPRALNGWTAAVGLGLICGAMTCLPKSFGREETELSRREVESLIERTLAHRLADQAGPAGTVILAPPARTASLSFYGGLRGLGTPTWENQDGVAATVLIVTATTADEAQALINQRGITHLVLLSWDSDLDGFAELTLSRPSDSFIAALHRWALPPWLKPWPYHLPTIAGFEGESVVILEVTEENERAPALSRVAEYFIEMQQWELAAAAGETLQQFPADLGALIARAEIEKARSDSAAFAKTFALLVSTLSGGFDRALAWDRRVSLAVVLAQGNRADLAQKQVQRCLKEINEERIRSLTTTSLYRLQALANAYGLKISDPRLSELARALLPEELRSRLP